MPNYLFYDVVTNKETTEFMWLSELDQYLKDHPNLRQGVTTHTNTLDPHRMGRKKADPRFREHLRNMKNYYKSDTMQVD